MTNLIMPSNSIKSNLKFHKITQKLFSETLGISLRTVQRWVRQDEMPKWGHLALNQLINGQIK